MWKRAPFLMARLHELQDRFLSPSAPLPNVQGKFFWYDTVNAHLWALRGSKETVGPERLLTGTDSPFRVNDAFVLALRLSKPR
jgi:hypothetical protein